MRKSFPLFALLAFFLILSFPVLAQVTPADEPVQMADGLRASGKIYVVVAVVVSILLGIFAYLINIDRKISRLEKK